MISISTVGIDGDFLYGINIAGANEYLLAIQAIIIELGASSMKDMGRVMAEVKARHASSIEPARASALVKAALAG